MTVTVNLFMPFDEWPKNTTLYPIKDGLGKNLHEVVLTSRTVYFFFIGMSTTSLSCSLSSNSLEAEPSYKVNDGELVPFPIDDEREVSGSAMLSCAFFFGY
jgi:hypothetical protein